MNENLHNIDKLFRDGIEGQEEMPAPNIWNELDKKLDKKKVDSIAGKYYKLKWVAAALFIFSIGMGMYVYRIHKHSELVKNSGSKESAVGTNTRKKQADAGIQSTDVTAESNKNTLHEKPPVMPVEKDSLLIKDQPVKAPVIEKHDIPANASLLAGKRVKLQHDPAQKEIGPSASKDQHPSLSSTQKRPKQYNYRCEQSAGGEVIFSPNTVSPTRYCRQNKQTEQIG